MIPIALRTPFSIGRVNCYVLPGTPLTLIDTGPTTAEALSDLEDGLAEHGLSIADIELVLLTHQHFDHFGNASVIAERSGCSVAAHEGLVDYLGRYEESMIAENDYQAAVMEIHGVPDDLVTERRTSQAFRDLGAAVRIDRPLGDGDMIEAGGRMLRVLFRPGHSPSDAIFVDEARRDAFVGDHLLATIASNPIAHRPLAGPADPRARSSSLAGYRVSLAETAELDLDILHTGHGEPVREHKQLIAERLSLQHQRKETVLAKLGSRPATAHEIACSIWGDVAISQAYLTLSGVLGALDLLKAENRSHELEQDGVYLYTT